MISCDSYNTSLIDFTILARCPKSRGKVRALELPIEKSQVAPRIVNYVTRPNLVNTCNGHVGEVREIVMTFRETLEKTVKFKVNPTDLGMGAPKRLPVRHTHAEFMDWIEDGKKQHKKQKSTNAAMREMRVTLESHNLERVIETIEEGFKYNPVYKWPEATNKFKYGEEPCVPDSFTHFGADNLGAFIFSVIAVGVQAAKHVGSSVFWNLTKKLEGEDEVGVVQIGHSRNNTVYYTQQEYLLSQAVDRLEIPAQQLETSRTDNVVPLTWQRTALGMPGRENVQETQNNISYSESSTKKMTIRME